MKDMTKLAAKVLCKVLFTKKVLNKKEKINLIKDYIKFSRNDTCILKSN